MSEPNDMIMARAAGTCELCGTVANLVAFPVEPIEGDLAGRSLGACDVCRPQLEGGSLDGNQWFSLRDTIWSEIPAVQVQSWRLLHRIQGEAWATELLEQAYLEDDVLAWAQAGQAAAGEDVSVKTVDSNGSELHDGDTVTLIKDLEVKGAGFTAKRGTIVKGIRLTGDPENIDGRVNGTLIVLKTCFLKRQAT